MPEVAANPVGAVGASFVFGALILKLIDFVKYAKTSDTNGLVTLVTGWIVGVVAVWLILQTDWADEISIGSEPLDQMSFASKVVLGLVATSIANVLYDAKKAVDNTETSSTPRMTVDAEAERVRRIEALSVTRR